MNLLNIFFFDPFLNVLMLLYKVLGGNMGLAIIGLTILVRLAVLPLNLRMLRSQRRMQQLKPQLDELKSKHGKDRAALSQAQMELYKAEGVNPAGACLPTLLQFPFLIGVYAALEFVVKLHSVGPLNDRLYSPWLHLSSLSALHLHFAWLALGVPDQLLILPFLAAGSQFILSRMMLPAKSKLPKPENKAESSLEDSLLESQGMMAYFFPVITFFFTWKFPAGLGLYWTVGNVFSIIQQFYINRKLPIATNVVDVTPQIEPAEAPKTQKTKKRKKK